eukprot:542066-Alexandrium_andersonii.AAC.1
MVLNRLGHTPTGRLGPYQAEAYTIDDLVNALNAVGLAVGRQRSMLASADQRAAGHIREQEEARARAPKRKREGRADGDLEKLSRD